MKRFSLDSSISNLEYRYQLLKKECEELFLTAIKDKETVKIGDDEDNKCFISYISDFSGDVINVIAYEVYKGQIYCKSLDEENLDYPLNVHELGNPLDVLEILKFAEL